jgi:dsRNA-specific ribonuclease
MKAKCIGGSRISTIAKNLGLDDFARLEYFEHRTVHGKIWKGIFFIV